MGVDHGGTGDKSPRITVFRGWDTNVNCSPYCRFCHIGIKRSVLWPSKYAKIRFRSGLCSGPCWGAHNASQTPQSAGSSLRIPYLTPHRPTFGARHASPQNSSQIYAYGLRQSYRRSGRSVHVCERSFQALLHL